MGIQGGGHTRASHVEVAGHSDNAAVLASVFLVGIFILVIVLVYSTKIPQF